MDISQKTLDEQQKRMKNSEKKQMDNGWKNIFAQKGEKETLALNMSLPNQMYQTMMNESSLCGSCGGAKYNFCLALLLFFTFEIEMIITHTHIHTYIATERTDNCIKSCM